MKGSKHQPTLSLEIFWTIPLVSTRIAAQDGSPYLRHIGDGRSMDAGAAPELFSGLAPENYGSLLPPPAGQGYLKNVWGLCGFGKLQRLFSFSHVAL